MPHDVFISHSSKDKTVADAACACLESRGIRCWVAPRDIVAGADWSESIIDGIHGAKAMLLILSSHSNMSKQVLREIERAANQGIPILPFRIEDIELSKSLQYFLSSAHWLDAYQGPLKHHVEKLANNVAIILERQDAVRSLPDSAAKPNRSRRAMFAIGAAVAAFLLTAVGGVVAWNRSPQTVHDAASVDEAPTGSKTPHLGFRMQDLLPAVAKKIDSKDAVAFVTAVHPRQVSGVQTGDILLRFRDKPIGSIADFQDHAADLSVRQKYPLTVLRNGQQHAVSVQPVLLEDGDLDRLEEKTFRELRSFDRPAGMVILSRIAVIDDAMVSIDHGGNAYGWKDVNSGAPPVNVASRTFSAVAANPRDKSFVLGDEKSGELVTWNPGVSAVTDVLEGSPGSPIVDLFVTDDGQRAVVIDEKARVSVWNLDERKPAAAFSLKEASGQQARTWAYMSAQPGDFSLSGNGRHLGQRTATKFIVWDLEKRTAAQVIDQDNLITACALSPDAASVAIGLENGMVEVWDVVEGRKRATLRWHTGEVSSVAFLSPHFLATASEKGKDGSIIVWDLRDRTVFWGFKDRFLGKSGILRGPRLIALRRSAGTLLSGIKLVRELPLPGDLAEMLRQERWKADEVNVLVPATASASESTSAVIESTSTVTATFADGRRKDIVQSGDKSQMVTERDSSGKTLAMRYVPGPDSCGLGLRLGRAGKDETESDAVVTVQDGIRVEEVVAGGQADRDGVIRAGDVITAVVPDNATEATPLPGLHIAEVQRLMMGPDGTTVKLRILRDGATTPVEIVARRGKLKPVRHKAVRRDFKNSIGMEFVAIPAGRGSLGIVGDRAAMAPHYVRLSKGYLIGAHEVTQKEFLQVMDRRPSEFAIDGKKSKLVTTAAGNGAIPNADTGHHPVDSVSWEDADAFCRKLSEREGRTYRLPTEAEWEWACRNAGSVKWAMDSLSGSWVDETAVGRHLEFPETTHPVGGRSPGDSGLYDMFGNVAEWCGDLFADDGFATARCVDPQGPDKGIKRVIRGGSFQDSGTKFFERSGLAPQDKRPYVGFRVVLEPTRELLEDPAVEAKLIDSAMSPVDESRIPNPIPPLAGMLRTAAEEEEEFKKILAAIEMNEDLRGLRTRLLESGAANQSQFTKMRMPWCDLNNRLGDDRAARAMKSYNAAHVTDRLGERATFFDSAAEADSLLGWVANDAAWAYSTDSNPDRRDPLTAINHAIRACEESRWQYWGFLDTLAVALAADGRFESAVRVAEAALARVPEAERAEVQSSLERFKKGEGYEPLEQ
jgi:formylglycine-generating enzyme required for sulfatase activity/WD40 repeat protein